MKKSKNKALVVLVIALVVVLLASFAAQAFNTSGYSVSVSRILTPSTAPCPACCTCPRACPDPTPHPRW